ncbi:MAG: cation transporter, partial [Gemmatimonadota bacterium]
MSTKTVNVPNISCGHCVMTIEREVGEIDGVSSVKA